MATTSTLSTLLALDPLLQRSLQTTALGQIAQGKTVTVGGAAPTATSQVIPPPPALVQASLAGEAAAIGGVMNALSASLATPSTSLGLTNSAPATAGATLGGGATDGTFTIRVNSLGTAGGVTSSNTNAVTATTAQGAVAGTFNVVVAAGTPQTNTGTALDTDEAFNPTITTGGGQSFAGQNLNKADLTGANLPGANFAGANLNQATLAGANLQAASFVGANTNKANFAGANLEGANFTGANLNGANFENANLLNANFTGANLNGADFTGAQLGVGGTLAITVNGTTTNVNFSTTAGLNDGVPATPTTGDVANAVVNAINGANLGLTASLNGNNQVVIAGDTAGTFSITGADAVGAQVATQFGLNNVTTPGTDALTATVNGATVALTNGQATIDNGAVTINALQAGTSTVTVRAATPASATVNGAPLAIGANNTAALENGAIQLDLHQTGTTTISVAAGAAQPIPGVTSNAGGFVTAFNNLSSFLSSNSLFAPASQQLQAAVQNNAGQLAGIGITVNNGPLQVDQSRLSAASAGSGKTILAVLNNLASASQAAAGTAQQLIAQTAAANSAPPIGATTASVGTVAQAQAAALAPAGTATNLIVPQTFTGTPTATSVTPTVADVMQSAQTTLASSPAVNRQQFLLGELFGGQLADVSI